MAGVPRIVVADASGDVARIVRGAMALLNRQFILIEVPTSDDALAEVSRTPIDLLVTAYRTPGAMHGIDLALQVRHESLSTPVIVLAEKDDPQIEPKVLEQATFQYFMRPVAEPFLTGLRVALDGEASVAAQAVPIAVESDFGPLPDLDIRKVRSIVVNLIRDVGAMGIIVADRSGRVLVDEGATGYIDREMMAAIVGPMFARVANVAPLLGGRTWTMHYYNGERLDVYALALGIHYVMFLVFEANHRAMAAVMLYGRQTAHRIIETLGAGAYEIRRPEPLPPPKEQRLPPEQVAAAEREVAPAVALAAARKAPEPLLEPVPDLDVDLLFGQPIDEQMVDALFSPDALVDLVETLDTDGERVGYDEAIDLGILDD